MTLPVAIIQRVTTAITAVAILIALHGGGVAPAAVIPPANRYQMGKIELVTVALIIIT